MGIFSSKKVIHVGTSVVRMVEDEAIPDNLKIGTFKSIMRERSLSQSVRQQVFNGTYLKFERMYRYAERGDYFYGLPNARVLTSTDGIAAAKAAIESEVGGPVTINYAYFRPINHVHQGRKHITENLGHDDQTNELTVLSTGKGFPVYLKDLVATYKSETDRPPDNLARGVFGESPNSGGTPARQARFPGVGLGSLAATQNWREGTTETDGVEIVYTWLDGDEVLQEEMLFLDLGTYNEDTEYYQAQYVFNGQTAYWTYSPEQGLHAGLDGVYDPAYVEPGTYFPFAMFRRNSTNRTADAVMGSPEFLSTEKLLKHIGVDFKSLGDSIHENPDIADVEQAVMMMGVPIISQDPVEIDYLYRFFRNLHISTPARPPRQARVELSRGSAANYAVEIADADFRFVMSYTATRRRLKPGSIGPIGTLTNTMALIADNGESAQLNIPGEAVVTRYFRKQITKQIYEEVAVAEPAVRFDIYEGKGTIGGATDENLLIPLDYSIVREMTLLDREWLYFRSLHLVANSRVTQTVKWYEQAWFADLLKIVAIALVAFGVFSGIAEIAAALSTGVGAAALVLLELILTSVIMDVVAGVVVDILGPEFALVLAALLAVWGGVKAVKAGGVGQDVWAENLLVASNGLSSGVNTKMAEMRADYLAEEEAFELMKEEKWEELEEVNDLLKSNHILNPHAFVGSQPLTVFGETPDAYYERTIHTGNIGAMGADIIENFVNVSLKLPDIHSTVGDIAYV